MNANWERISIEFKNKAEAEPVPIVSDAAISSRGIADGKMIPLLILDTRNRPEIEDIINSHEFYGPGDADSIWQKFSKRDKYIRLIICFKKPIEANMVIEFEIQKQGILVDGILASQASYIQGGKPGINYSSSIEEKRILVEISSSPDMIKAWNEAYHHAFQKMGKKQGLGKKEAKKYAEKVIKESRSMSKFRLRDNT